MEFIGVDHGNAQIKTANCCHPSYRVDTLPYEPAQDPDGPVVVSGENGIWYMAKPGTVLPYTQMKTTDEWMAHTKIAIAEEILAREDKKRKSANSERERERERYRVEVVLGVGVPNAAVLSRTEINTFESFFEKSSPLTYTYKGFQFEVTIKKAFCFRQGRVILGECDKASGQRTAVIDIGGYTTDAFVTEGDGKTLKIVHTGSVKSGLNSVKRNLASTMTNVLGRTVSEEVVESWLRHSDRLPGLIGKQRTEIFLFQTTKWVSELLSDLTETIFNGISYMDLSRIVLAGGGALALEDAIKAQLTSYGVPEKSIKIVSDPVHANARGFEAAAKTKWTLEQRKAKKRTK